MGEWASPGEALSSSSEGGVAQIDHNALPFGATEFTAERRGGAKGGFGGFGGVGGSPVGSMSIREALGEEKRLFGDVWKSGATDVPDGSEEEGEAGGEGGEFTHPFHRTGTMIGLGSPPPALPNAPSSVSSVDVDVEATRPPRRAAPPPPGQGH